MSDIVERLRNQSILDVWHPMMLEAAAEILRLRAENEKLRAALCGVTSELEQFVQIFKGYQGMTMSNAQAALRAAAAALKETGDETPA